MRQHVMNIGDRLEYRRVVTPEDVAMFQGKVIHPVCATFALARDIEWAARQFALRLCEEDEEGIGTQLTIDHQRPALVGDTLVITTQLDQYQGNELICSYTATVDGRVIATGKTGQKILKREKIDRLFSAAPRGSATISDQS